jgi:hypothetical protein
MHTGELSNAFCLTGRQLLVPAPSAWSGQDLTSSHSRVERSARNTLMKTIHG